jgi:hypothetical protein
MYKIYDLFLKKTLSYINVGIYYSTIKYLNFLVFRFSVLESEAIEIGLYIRCKLIIFFRCSQPTVATTFPF